MKPRYVPLTKSGEPMRVKPRAKLYQHRCAVDGREYGFSRRLFALSPLDDGGLCGKGERDE